tara:strand:- start:384 stop:662 length:279 start_codon:yes stop_codon:yes gene_type:complete
MKSFRLYLPKESEQNVQCERWKHLFNMIDRIHNEVRVYISGIEFSENDAKYPLPYAVIEGKRVSFEHLYEMVLVKTGKAEDDYIPKEDNEQD